MDLGATLRARPSPRLVVGPWGMLGEGEQAAGPRTAERHTLISARVNYIGRRAPRLLPTAWGKWKPSIFNLRFS